MRWPLNKFTITQGYKPGHTANDLAAPTGTPILAPDNGVIIGINNNPSGYFGGNYLKLRGDSGYTFYMGHNSLNRVTLNQCVNQGQHIADVGQTGEATGPHVHFEITKGNQTFDPSSIIKEEEDVTISNNNEATYLTRLGTLVQPRDDSFTKTLVGLDLTSAIRKIEALGERRTATERFNAYDSLVTRIKELEQQGGSEAEEKLKKIKEILL